MFQVLINPYPVTSPGHVHLAGHAVDWTVPVLRSTVPAGSQAR